VIERTIEEKRLHWYGQKSSFIPIKYIPVRQVVIMKSIGTITTSLGDIEIDLYSDVAPRTVENFKKLARSGFYDTSLFHRIVPGFVIQGGDPESKDASNRSKWGTGGPGWNIKAEFNKTSHSRGVLSMARSKDPDSAGSQFFIVLKDSKFLDGQYTVFGKVVAGMDEVVDKIAALDTDSADAPLNDGKAKMLKVTVRES
jgi:cyclophilin family peptidyl-prolyl cis-trans isomerase